MEPRLHWGCSPSSGFSAPGIFFILPKCFLATSRVFLENILVGNPFKFGAESSLLLPLSPAMWGQGILGNPKDGCFGVFAPEILQPAITGNFPTHAGVLGVLSFPLPPELSLTLS